MAAPKGAGRSATLLCVRADQLFAVMDRFGLDEPLAALESSEPEAVDGFVERVVSIVGRRSS